MRRLVSNKTASVVSVAMSTFGMFSTASATEFNAEAVMTKMESKERLGYIAGVIEGLAYARFRRDNPNLDVKPHNEVGMRCVYDWYYEKKGSQDTIYALFIKYPNYPVGPIIYTLLQKNCPE